MRRLRLLTLACLGALLAAPPAGAVTAPRCTFGPGALPAQTMPNRPHGSAIPIDHVVVLMQENRSFDHYFGQLHYQGQPRSRPEPQRASNPDPTNPSGPRISAFHQTHYCEVADLDHSWSGTHREWNGGRMDGFTAQNQNPDDPTGSRTMGFYDSSDLPFYYALYGTFAMADRFFSSVLSQTFPNRFYLLAGTSFGHIRNDFPQDCPQPCNPLLEYSQRTIFNLLDEAAPPVSWKIYFHEVPFADEFAYVRSRSQNVVAISNYFADAAAGTLPQVAFVDPLFIGSSNTENDEHPTSNIQVGEEFVARVINALLASPQWPRSALFLTYDEHGGFYDHRRPPPACVPDDIAPFLEEGDVPGAFDRYGIRVPAVVVSPFARARYVSHRVYDHTSILRFIETRFDLPALTARDANADPMLKLFDFRNPPFIVPPALPAAPIDQAHFAEPVCAEGKGSGGL